MTAKIDGKNLIITVEMNEEPTPSASGKTLVVATTHGNQKTSVQVNGKDVIVGLNAYIRRN